MASEIDREKLCQIRQPVGRPEDCDQQQNRCRDAVVCLMSTEVEHRQAPYQPSTVELIGEEPDQEDEVARDTMRLQEIEKRGRQIHLRLRRAEEENQMLRSDQRLGARREVQRGFHFQHVHLEVEGWKIY